MDGPMDLDESWPYFSPGPIWRTLTNSHRMPHVIAVFEAAALFGQVDLNKNNVFKFCVARLAFEYLWMLLMVLDLSRTSDRVILILSRWRSLFAFHFLHAKFQQQHLGKWNQKLQSLTNSSRNVGCIYISYLLGLSSSWCVDCCSDPGAKTDNTTFGHTSIMATSHVKLYEILCSNLFGIRYSSGKNSQESMHGKQNFTQRLWNDWKNVEIEHWQDLRKIVRAPYPEKKKSIQDHHKSHGLAESQHSKLSCKIKSNLSPCSSHS